MNKLNLHSFYLLLLACLFLAGCSSNSDKAAQGVSFYVWKTQPALGEEEKRVFQEVEAQKLYVRFFDIAEDDDLTQPRAILKNFDPDFISTEIVPTIFITNESFYGSTENDIAQLAENIYNTIRQMASDMKMDFKEIQIDCDWTSGTKNNYFSFLENLRELSHKEITSTLRLHQIKYSGSVGIPPVDKVYLMAYATSSPIEEQGKNSILDLDLLRDYTRDINAYPLEFDIALPLYSWAIVSNHFDKKKLINGIAEEDLLADDFEKVGDRYIAKKNLFLGGLYINKGFKVKVEGITPELLAAAKTYFEEKVDKPYHLVYYHLDKRFTNRFDTKDL